LDNINDCSKWQGSYDFLFGLNINYISFSLHFRDTDDVSFFEFKAFLATSGGHSVTLNSGFDF